MKVVEVLVSLFWGLTMLNICLGFAHYAYAKYLLFYDFSIKPMSYCRTVCTYTPTEYGGEVITMPYCFSNHVKNVNESVVAQIAYPPSAHSFDCYMLSQLPYPESGFFKASPRDPNEVSESSIRFTRRMMLVVLGALAVFSYLCFQ